MESHSHADNKYDLYWTLTEAGIMVDVEKMVGSTRTDLLIELNSHLLAVEIQCTPISINEIVKRMREHTRKNAHTLWLIDEKLLQNNEYSRNLNWVGFIQNIQNGVIFLPTNSCQIVPARVDNAMCYHRGKLVTKKKYLDKRLPIDIGDLCFDKNDGMNIVSINEWWVESYVDLA